MNWIISPKWGGAVEVSLSGYVKQRSSWLPREANCWLTPSFHDQLEHVCIALLNSSTILTFCSQQSHKPNRVVKIGRPINSSKHQVATTTHCRYTTLQLITPKSTLQTAAIIIPNQVACCQFVALPNFATYCAESSSNRLEPTNSHHNFRARSFDW
jgi:hypothetical protein